MSFPFYFSTTWYTAIICLRNFLTCVAVSQNVKMFPCVNTFVRCWMKLRSDVYRSDRALHLSSLFPTYSFLVILKLLSNTLREREVRSYIQHRELQKGDFTVCFYIHTRSEYLALSTLSYTLDCSCSLFSVLYVWPCFWGMLYIFFFF